MVIEPEVGNNPVESTVIVVTELLIAPLSAL